MYQPRWKPPVFLVSPCRRRVVYANVLAVLQEEADVGLLVVDTVKRPTQEVFNVVKAIAPKPSLCQRALGEPQGVDVH